MPQVAVEFHPLAADEAETAERLYSERNETASARFRRELPSPARDHVTVRTVRSRRIREGPWIGKVEPAIALALVDPSGAPHACGTFTENAERKRFVMIKDPDADQSGSSAGMILVLSWIETLKDKLPAK